MLTPDRDHILDREGTTQPGKGYFEIPRWSTILKNSSKTRPFPARKVFQALFTHFGPQHWWPARTDTEMMIGAVLVQNTAWTNTEKAIARLRKARALLWAALHRMPPARLAELIRPAGYFNV